MADISHFGVSAKFWTGEKKVVIMWWYHQLNKLYFMMYKMTISRTHFLLQHLRSMLHELQCLFLNKND